MAMEDPGDQFSEPLLEYSKYHDEHKSMLESLREGTHGMLAAAGSVTGLSYARKRTLLRRNRTQRAEGWGSWARRVLMWPVLKVQQIEKFKFPFALPVKAGIAAVIAGLLCFAPGFLKSLNNNGAWAVITVDIVLEANVGLTFSKGVNRTLGTLLAALLALLVDYVSPAMGGFESVFLLFCTFLGGAIPTVFKFRQPFKDRWNYAVVMSMITFHLLILTSSTEKVKLPMIRLATIAIGFVIASLVNLIIFPNFAGNSINNLLATNFERAGSVVEKCATDYCNGRMLQQVPDILSHHSSDDELHACFHEIVAVDSEVEKLLTAARTEPPHGKFFWRYPWDLYEDVMENLRYTLYDVVALDSCLRAEIQAPLNLRTMIKPECTALAKEIAEVFRALGQTMRKMEHVDTEPGLLRTEEVTMSLQHKIAKFTDILSGKISLPDPLNESFHGGAKKILSAEDSGEVQSELNNGESSGRSVAASDTMDSTDLRQPEFQKTEQLEREKEIKDRATRLEARVVDVLKRRPSIREQWDVTVQRLAALSLIKFASQLIELAAKAKYIASVVDDLAVKARFDEMLPLFSKSGNEFGTP